ncbi:uncharacterized protein BJ212DRAFT_1294669 [Suillus subaureus]|uniref:Uncharacterized protein n=1 Tax=Suillus subaureus TaxID=48587 RepID=A0A9P7EP33_9AGAM|nr:uncharacterized protein BJ212DRAFT_1294669 [Suillus subaureus]KAG1827376.1 hypothetical protein BJ212DRAFT_1294669 [Suillus subaureus]
MKLINLRRSQHLGQLTLGRNCITAYAATIPSLSESQSAIGNDILMLSHQLATMDASQGQTCVIEQHGTYSQRVLILNASRRLWNKRAIHNEIEPGYDYHRKPHIPYLIGKVEPAKATKVLHFKFKGSQPEVKENSKDVSQRQPSSGAPRTCTRASLSMKPTGSTTGGALVWLVQRTLPQRKSSQPNPTTVVGRESI